VGPQSLLYRRKGREMKRQGGKPLGGGSNRRRRSVGKSGKSKEQLES